jgi:hypothetical protein
VPESLREEISSRIGTSNEFLIPKSFLSYWV